MSTPAENVYDELDARISTAQGDQDDPLSARASGQEISIPADPDQKSGWQHLKDAVSMVQRHPFTTGIGMIENAASQTAGAVGRTLGRAKNIALDQPMNQSLPDWSWQPHTEAGKEQNALTEEELKKVSGTYDTVAGTGPVAQEVKSSIGPIMDAAATLGVVKGGTSVFRGPKAIPAEPPHPLAGAAEAETQRIAGLKSQAESAGLDLPEGGTAARHGDAAATNQPIANDLTRQELALPKDAPLTADMLDKARAQYASPAYEAVKQEPIITLGKKYQSAIADLKETPGEFAKGLEQIGRAHV